MSSTPSGPFLYSHSRELELPCHDCGQLVLHQIATGDWMWYFHRWTVEGNFLHGCIPLCPSCMEPRSHMYLLGEANGANNARD